MLPGLAASVGLSGQAADDICYRIIDVEVLRLQQLGDDGARPAAAADRRADRASARCATPGQGKISTHARPSAPSSIRSIECFADNEATILASGFAAELLDAIPAAEAMRALKNAARAVYVSKPVIEVGGRLRVLGGLLEAFVTTVNDLAA